MKRSALRGIPAVEKIVMALGDTELPRPAVVAVARRELAALRESESVPDFDGVLARVRDAVRKLASARIRPVINGTGILIHTNLGRAPLGRAVIERLSQVGSSYSNLEYSVSQGERGGRAAYLEHNLPLLCGAEAATVVNNNAAALVLILRHFCQQPRSVPAQRKRSGARDAAERKNEVVISRGELVQIGGGFRIPEILEASGARLREVGTTNKTSLGDYAGAITARTALILKVHRSNFFMAGFVESASTQELATLARKRRVPFVEDLGSGAMIETQTIGGLEHEPTPAEVLRHGVDLVSFSGDKLLGGPQAGIIAGKSKFVAALKREPFFRVLRCDKLVLSGLETVVDCYLRARDGNPLSGKAVNNGCSSQSEDLGSGVPVLGMLAVSNEELRGRAEKLMQALSGLRWKASIGGGEAQIGGGTLPRSVIPSVTLDLVHPELRPQDVSARLREHSTPVIGYVARDKFKLDLRTVFPEQDSELVRALGALAGPRR